MKPSQSSERYAEIRPKHGGILHETGAARLDDILNEGLDGDPFVELNSVEAFQRSFIGLNRVVGRCLNILIEFAEVAVSEGDSKLIVIAGGNQASVEKPVKK